LRQAREEFDLRPLVIHDNYLINLAAEQPGLRQQSVASFRAEVERAVAIGAEYLVAHPGSYGAQGLERGILTLVESLRDAVGGLKMDGLMILIENTAGGGTKLGGCFEELKVIREVAGTCVDAAIGFCLDTAHCLESGYDIAHPEGLRDMVRRADALLGIEHVRVMHANDSKTPLGSHSDRHEHIGDGFIGAEGFRGILNHPKLRSKPFILETPHDADEDARRNLETLRALCRKRPTITKASN
jgi:deoxyribonuclease IV